VNIPKLLVMSPKLLVLIFVSGCGTTIVAYDGPCEPRYQPILIPEDLQIRTPKEVLEIVVTNQRGFKKNIKDAESLSGCGKD
jgi:hypothetical protein